VSALLLLITAALVAYVRLRLADVPLERDEGEYAYAGQLILQGTPPYELAYNMKFPGTYYAYAALMAVFGQTAWGIRAGLLCVHLATMGLLFLAGRRLLGTFAGAVGASAFALLALDRWSMGVFAHATHFVTFAVVAGVLALLHAVRTGRTWLFIASGVLMGVAVIMKQHAAAFVMLAMGLAAWNTWRDDAAHRREIWRRFALVAMGAAFPLAALPAVLAAEGVLARFWFWTVTYAAAYVSQVPWSAADDTLVMALRYITQANGWLWYTALAGLVVLLLSKWRAGTRVTLTGWLLAAALAIVPGLFFRPHYFIVLMPVAGLLVGVAAAAADRTLVRWIGATGARLAATGLFIALAAAYIAHDARYLFSMTHTELVRAVYGTNPFLESPEIGRYLHAHTGPDDRIVVLGSEPQLFFYAGRKSATGYIYTYPLMENQPYAARMQDEFRREVEAARPKYLVFVGMPLSWGTSPQSNSGVLTWANEFTARCYELAGIADINPAGDATIRWDADARSYRPRFPSQVWTFSRRAGGACAS
jgi:4-amino-4-deoxy-L-arabinose transferase-like glycosyltransferase